MSNKLKLWFDKNINDIKGCLPNGEKGRWDIYLLFNAFLGIKILDDNNLITELKNRGYDISTIKFEITKKNSEIQPVTTKDLTLDMWDKSVVNKIKRLEKSIELNNKVKKDLKKQLDQLKQQLAEKDKEIKKLNWQLKDKDFIIKNLNHSLSVAPNANAGQRARIDELTKIVKEKDKEIEKLKQRYTILENENGKLTTELIMDKYKKAQKEVSFGKQLAIQELVEVERLLYESHYKEIDGKYYAEYEDINNLIDNRIKALEGLKGEQT